VFSLVCVAIALQESLITAPYTVYALDHPAGPARRRYLGGVLTHSNILGALVGLASGVAALVFFDRGDAEYAWASVALAVIVPGVLLREFARRIVYAEMKPEDAVAISGASGVAQLVLMVALGLAGRLTATTALLSMGVASLVGGGIWLYRRREAFQFRGAPIREPFVRNWTIGKWSFATQVGEIVRTQMFPWLIALVADRTTVGIFAACSAIAALPTPLHVAVSNLLIPQLVHAEKKGGSVAAHRLMWQATGWLASVMVAFCAVIMLLGDRSLSLFYGDKFVTLPGTGHALVVLALSQLLNGATLPSARALFALRGPDKAFASQMVGIVVNLGLGLPMVSRWGIVGAAYAALIGSMLKAVLGTWWYAQAVREARRQEMLVPIVDEPAASPRSPLHSPRLVPALAGVADSFAEESP
jgi:O-antigen/teichoic acid export membrane protein